MHKKHTLLLLLAGAMMSVPLNAAATGANEQGTEKNGTGNGQQADPNKGDFVAVYVEYVKEESNMEREFFMLPGNKTLGFLDKKLPKISKGGKVWDNYGIYTTDNGKTVLFELRSISEVPSKEDKNKELFKIRDSVTRYTNSMLNKKLKAGNHVLVRGLFLPFSEVWYTIGKDGDRPNNKARLASQIFIPTAIVLLVLSFVMREKIRALLFRPLQKESTEASGSSDEEGYEEGDNQEYEENGDDA